MAWLSVSEKGKELIHATKPTHKTQWYDDPDDDNHWFDHLTPFDIIELPKGTIKRLIGKELTWADEPVILTN